MQAALDARANAKTDEEVEAEAKRWAWKKGDFQIVPYGIMWGATNFDSQRCENGDYCLWIKSPTLHPGESDASVDAKSTRLGIDLAGPGVPWLDDAKINGKVEVDFQGQFNHSQQAWPVAASRLYRNKG